MPDNEATSHEREVRAARNQSLFHSVNERLAALNEAFERVTKTFIAACECADTGCVEMLTISPDQYRAVRGEPRHLVVLPGHVYAEVERIVEHHEHYIVVEKLRAAGELAEVKPWPAGELAEVKPSLAVELAEVIASRRAGGSHAELTSD